MRRVVVLGAAGAGKSTFSADLASRIGGVHVERDRLWSDNVPMESPGFRAAVGERISGSTWVFDGMPFYVEDIVFAAADTVVCLDYAKRTVMTRVIRRSLRQSLLRQRLGVHEPVPFMEWRKPDHPVRWAWSTHSERRRQMREWVQRSELSHTHRVSLCSPGAARRWLGALGSAS